MHQKITAKHLFENMSQNNKKVVFQGQMIEILQEVVSSNGKEIILENGRRAPGVRLIIETPDKEFLITKEEMHKIGWDYRLPGGKVFDSLIEYNNFLALNKGKEGLLEEAKKAAIKEGTEEVGIEPTEMELLHISKCGGSFEWDLYYFVVKKYKEVGQHLEEHEKIEVKKFSRDELKELVFSNQMNEDRSVAVLLKYLNK